MESEFRCSAEHQTHWQDASKRFFFYCVAERAVKPCRSSRSNTRGGMIKSHDTCKTGSKTHRKGGVHIVRVSATQRTRSTEMMKKGDEGKHNQQGTRKAVRKLKCKVPGCRAQAIQIQDLVKSRVPEKKSRSNSYNLGSW